ncbi:MAG TPA: hypothetical protein VNQ34_07225 [Xanthobacteraceae bacterium]|nr:hypothetical protein [Xanthobacteraceae bacterium]
MSTSPENESKPHRPVIDEVTIWRANSLRYLSQHRACQWEFRDPVTLEPRDNPALRIAIERAIFGWPSKIPDELLYRVRDHMRRLRREMLTQSLHHPDGDRFAWECWLRPIRKMGLVIKPNFSELDRIYEETERLAFEKNPFNEGKRYGSA